MDDKTQFCPECEIRQRQLDTIAGVLSGDPGELPTQPQDGWSPALAQLLDVLKPGGGKIEAEVCEGKLCVDAEELFNSLSKLGKRRVAKSIAFSETLIEAMVKWLTRGSIDWENADFDSPEYDDENSHWWIGSTHGKETLEDARRALVGKRDEILLRLIKDLLCARDYAVHLSDQWRDAANKLRQHWPDQVATRPDILVDYFFDNPWTAERAEAFLTMARKNIAEGRCYDDCAPT